ncbi:MAG: hypothetical protein COV67_14280 [Nitrospinae bacterium CG11_big_fil_rev_8_21_14_0_20_56_8]|nr:MAG: hypothetical protein COV67_14280 [Nitrospinae bacterium CG11_big_fil_rev_8_21_14_0_20_56_8]
MNDTARRTGSRLHPGTMVLGRVREKAEPHPTLLILFKCRKDGVDFLGQVRLVNEGPSLVVELFNETYFSLFEVSKQEVLSVLASKLIASLSTFEPIPPSYSETVEALKHRGMGHLEALPVEPVPEEDARPDLQEIFSRLNREFFERKIEARVIWGRDTQTPNKTSFRFGSYHAKSKTIRLHPRLSQEFVPRIVLELTLFHEMCHQWAPSVRKKGQNHHHHGDFKAKEKEYPFYTQARDWEKQNWKKLLAPVEGAGVETLR